MSMFCWYIASNVASVVSYWLPSTRQAQRHADSGSGQSSPCLELQPLAQDRFELRHPTAASASSVAGSTLKPPQELMHAIMRAPDSRKMARLASQLIAKGGINLDGTDHEGKSPVYLAIQEGQRAIAAELIQAGVNVSQASVFQRAPLHVAAGQSDPWFTETLLTSAKTVSARVDIDRPDCLNRTPLHYAVWRGHPDSVRLLLEAGANPNIPDNTGQTPLDKALQELDDAQPPLLQQKLDILRHLLQVDAKDGHALSPENRSGLPSTDTSRRLSGWLQFACDQPTQDLPWIELLLQQPEVRHPDEAPRGSSQEPHDTVSYRNYRRAIGGICRKRKIFPFDRRH